MKTDKRHAWTGVVLDGMEVAWTMIGADYHAVIAPDENDAGWYWLSLYLGNPDDEGAIGGTRPVNEAAMSDAHYAGCWETMAEAGYRLARSWVEDDANTATFDELA